MPSNNGKQHHLTTREIVEAAKMRRSKPWHWDALDMDVLIRPRTTAENAAIVDESGRYTADVERYKGTPDEPTSLDAMRVKLRAALYCVLDPETRGPLFTPDDVETLLELDTPALTDLFTITDDVSNFTQAAAEEQEKNSGAMADGSTSSPSREAAATSTSSPTPIR